MTAYAPTYDWYKNTYHGSMDEDAFDASIAFADAAVWDLCYPQEPSDEAQADSYRMACCAVADGVENDEVQVSSWSVGAVSMTNADPSYLTVRRKAERFLVGTGLLYKGI